MVPTLPMVLEEAREKCLPGKEAVCVSLPMVLEEAREKCLPGKEAVCVSETYWSLWLMMNTDRERCRPLLRLRVRRQGRHRPGLASK
jgi:hypothetical protein